MSRIYSVGSAKRNNVMEPIIKAKNLNFTYNNGKENECRALVNIDLSIYPEEFVIIFGPSGCGKTTRI